MKIRYDNFTFFEGSLGSGKTTIITRCAIKEYNKRKIENIIRYPISLISFIIPIINIYAIYKAVKDKELIMPKRGTEIYTTYPIWINKKVGFSKVLDRSLFNWLYKYYQDCIIITDEMGWFYPPNENEKGKAIMTDKTERFGITFLRHAINPVCFCSSQSIDEVNITFRRKISHIYRLMNCRKSLIPFVSKVDILEIQRSEDMGALTRVNEDEIKTQYFIYPYGHFKSRYARRLYENDITAISYEELLKKLGLKAGDKWKEIYY